MILQTHIYRNVHEKENVVKDNVVRNLGLGAPRRGFIFACLALVAVCSLFLFTTVNVEASTVIINDQAGVLNAGRIQTEAAKLPVPLLIYTSKTFIGDQETLNQFTRQQLPNQNAIAVGIDTVHRHLSIQAGTTVPLSQSQASDALSAFQSHYNGGDYTAATIATLDSLHNALNGGGGINPLWVAVAILLGLVVVVSVVIATRRRRRGGSDGSPRMGSWRRGPWTTPYPYHGGIHTTGTPPSGNYGGGFGGGAGGGFGGGSFGGGAGGSF